MSELRSLGVYERKEKRHVNVVPFRSIREIELDDPGGGAIPFPPAR